MIAFQRKYACACVTHTRVLVTYIGQSSQFHWEGILTVCLVFISSLDIPRLFDDTFDAHVSFKWLKSSILSQLYLFGSLIFFFRRFFLPMFKNSPTFSN